MKEVECWRTAEFRVSQDLLGKIKKNIYIFQPVNIVPWRKPKGGTAMDKISHRRSEEGEGDPGTPFNLLPFQAPTPPGNTPRPPGRDPKVSI